ncbi:MAG: T9SS type A sorting domain-containing protein [Flavobacteriales bacterium]
MLCSRTLRLCQLVACCALLSPISAQVPIIDYGFQAVPPSVQVSRVLELPDGKILMGGFFLNYAGSGKNHMVRLNNDGTVDPTWNPSGIGPSNQVMDIAVMTDGRIVIAGNFSTYNGIASYFITRLLPNGDRDPAFNIPPNAINGAVLAIDIQNHDKVVAVGEFFTCYGHSMPHIARFLNTGAVDLSFDIGYGFNAVTRDILVLPDNRILVGGDFGSYNLIPTWGLAMLQAGGPYDASMTMAPGFTGAGSTVRKLLRQPDDKILVGGSFSYHNMQPSNALARINLDGTRDPSFVSPFYPYAGITALAVQADGMIYAGGEFSGGMYDPNVPGPARLNQLLPNGARNDAAYDLGEGPGLGTELTAYVRDVFVQADGKVLVGGYFGDFHNPAEIQYRNIIRLHGESSTGIAEQQTQAPLLHPNPSSDNCTLTFSDARTRTLELCDAQGRVLRNERAKGIQHNMQLHALPSGLYLVRGVEEGWAVRVVRD